MTVPSKISEFDIINKYLRPIATHQAALNLQDDVALIPGIDGYQWAITKDAIVAGIHFFPDDPPQLIAKKLVRCNLSDLAAKGAKPQFILMATCFPSTVSEEWLNSFFSGLKEDCEKFSLNLIGGDIVTTPGPLTLTLTAIGSVKYGQLTTRSGAQIGDHIWVSGTIGDSFLGLQIAQKNKFDKILDDDDRIYLIDRYLLPQPRVQFGIESAPYLHASMDISDGLLGDLIHITTLSQSSALIDLDKIPLSRPAQKILNGQSQLKIFDLIAGGDDYELLFTASQQEKQNIDNLAESLGINCTVIGEIQKGTDIVMVNHSGRVKIDPSSMKAKSYHHYFGATP
jgi:thiamine-monophosphate kinase